MGPQTKPLGEKKTARGPPAATKSKEKPIELGPEFTEEFSSVERELNSHRIGTFKVWRKEMTFQWQDRTNRDIASVSQQSRLRESMTAGIHRTDFANRMSGVIKKESIVNNIVHPPVSGQGPRHLKITEVDKLNKNAEYPAILVPL